MSPEQTGTILIVEDNPITRKMVRVALTSAGYRVFEATDGPSALHQLAEILSTGDLNELLDNVTMFYQTEKLKEATAS